MNTEDGLLNLPVQIYQSHRNDSGVWVKAFFAGRPPALILVDPDVSFVDFKQSIQDALLNATEHAEGLELSLAYLDADGDRLQLGNQEQLEGAIALYEKLKRSFVHVFCQPKARTPSPLENKQQNIEELDTQHDDDNENEFSSDSEVDNRAGYHLKTPDLFKDVLLVPNEFVPPQPQTPSKEDVEKIMQDVRNAVPDSLLDDNQNNNDEPLSDGNDNKAFRESRGSFKALVQTDILPDAEATPTAMFDINYGQAELTEPLSSPIVDIPSTRLSSLVVELVTSPLLDPDFNNVEDFEEKLHQASIFATVVSIFDNYLEEDEDEVTLSSALIVKTQRIRPVNRFKTEKITPFIVPLIKRQDINALPTYNILTDLKDLKGPLPKTSTQTSQPFVRPTPPLLPPVSEKKKEIVKKLEEPPNLNGFFLTATETQTNRDFPKHRFVFGSDTFLDLPKSAPLPDRRNENQFKLGPVLAKPLNKVSVTKKSQKIPETVNDNMLQPAPKEEEAPVKAPVTETTKSKKLFKKHVELRPKPAPKIAVKQSDRSLVPRITSNKPPTKHVKVAVTKPSNSKKSKDVSAQKHAESDDVVQRDQSNTPTVPEPVFEHRRTFLPPIPEDRISSPSFNPMNALLTHQKLGFAGSNMSQPVLLMDPVTGQLMYAPDPYQIPMFPYGQVPTRTIPPLLLERELNPNPRFEDLFDHDLDASEDETRSKLMVTAQSPKVQKAKAATKEASKPKYGWAVNGKYSRAK